MRFCAPRTCTQSTPSHWGLNEKQNGAVMTHGSMCRTTSGKAPRTAVRRGARGQGGELQGCHSSNAPPWDNLSEPPPSYPRSYFVGEHGGGWAVSHGPLCIAVRRGAPWHLQGGGWWAPNVSSVPGAVYPREIKYAESQWVLLWFQSTTSATQPCPYLPCGTLSSICIPVPLERPEATAARGDGRQLQVS